MPTCAPQPGAHGGLAPGGCQYVPGSEGTHFSTIVISSLTGTVPGSDHEYDIGIFQSRMQINLSLQSFTIDHMNFDRDFGENIPKDLSKQNSLSL